MYKYGFFVLLFFSLFATPSTALKLSSYNVEIPINNDAKITIIPDSANTAYTIDIYDKNIARVVRLSENTVTIKGTKTGQTILMAVDGLGRISAARLIVKDSPGELADILKMELSGTTVSSDILHDYLDDIIRLSSQLELDTEINYIFKDNTFTLHPLEWTVQKMAVSISGQNYYPLEKEVMLVVENRVTQEPEAKYLLFSNNPEVLSTNGCVYTESVLKNEAVRVVYHHGSLIGDEKRYLKLAIHNPSQTPSRIFLRKGTGGPSVDTLFVGHSATKRYMEKAINREGVYLTLPANKTIDISIQKLLSGQYLSGIFKIWLQEGPSVNVVLYVTTSEEDQNFGAKIPKDTVSSRISGKIAYPEVVITDKIYTSQDYKAYEIGYLPVRYNYEKEKLVGNYGIVHQYNLNIVNDEKGVEDVSFILAARGGFSRGCFYIDNELVETGVLDPYKEVEETLYKIRMNPNEQRSLLIKMFPQPGAYYPVNLIFQADEIM